MTRSTLLGCVAGLLMALDGLEFVLSRTAILDIFVMFWVLAAFGVPGARPGPVPGQARRARGGQRRSPATRAPGWASAGGACWPGCASAWPARRSGTASGTCRPSRHGRALGPGRAARRGFTAPGRGALSGVKWLPVSFGRRAPRWPTWPPGAAGSPRTYGYDRDWAAQHGNHTPIWSALDSLYQYQQSMLQFSVGLTVQHPYRSAPWTWPFLSRPVSFFYNTPPGLRRQELLAGGAGHRHPADLVGVRSRRCSFCLVWWLARRDWRAGAVLAGVAAGWLPWFWFACARPAAPSSSSTRWCSTRSW